MTSTPICPDVITPESVVPAELRPRLGFLYPRGGSGFEYYRFAEHFCDNLRCYLIGGMHAFGGNKTHYREPLMQMGSVENLSYPTRAMRPLDVHAGMWATTSASFIGGMQWSLDQAEAVSDILGAPVSNTALAFVSATRAVGAERVAVLASYPHEVTDAFRSFLGEADIAVTDFVHLDADCGEDAFEMEEQFLIDEALKLDYTGAQALLIPDTAMAAFPLIAPLERELGIPVLTANQVTIFEALRLAGARVATQAYGTLFSGAEIRS
jgi:maleate cis-trans isomerase